MKHPLLIIILGLLSIVVSGQKSYKGLPLVKAKNLKADYRINNDWTKGNWTISPQVSADSLLLTCHSENDLFGFYTDVDSILFKLRPGKISRFYVSVKDSAYALTVIKGVKPNYASLHFDTETQNKKLSFWYEQNNNNEFLNKLRAKYPFDELAGDSKSDTEKALKVLHWVHLQWRHDGNNEPKKNDALSILEEVKEGKNFRCVEYGIVATACLNSIGLKARILGLKTKNVETTQSGAGHVLLEVYLNDLKKWVMLDGQWDAMPVLKNIPLNAVEFQKAISENYNELEIRSLSQLSKRNYIDWIYPYLYYFDVPFDNTEGKSTYLKNKIDGKGQLMLVPLGSKEPTVFQVTNKIDYCLYTHSLNDFYAPPGF